MKIFQIITVSEYGGAQTIVANLIKALSPQHEVFVLYGGEGEAWSSSGDNFTRIRLSKHRRNISLYDFILLLKLFYYRIKYKPDIIHLHSSKMGVLGRLAFNSKNTIYTVHGFDSVRKQHRRYLFMEKILKSKVSQIVGVSQYDVNSLIKENISRNVVCIYNGVTDLQNNPNIKYDLPFVKQIKDISSQYAKTIMCVARISEQKRFDLFCDIAESLPQYAFIWIGNKEPINNIPKNVFALGEIDSAQIYLKFTDLFILCSNYEGLPMSLLEAMSFGKPAVASAVGGIPEVLNKGNGFAVENGVNAFKEKIDYILSNDDVYKDMSDKSRKSFLENHSTEKMVNEYLQIYKSLATK